MSSVEYQRYTHKHLVDRLAPTSWGNLVLAGLVLAISLTTSSYTYLSFAVYVLFGFFIFLRLRFHRAIALRQYHCPKGTDLRADANYFSFLIAGTGFCWALIIMLPAILNTHSSFWTQFVYFFSTGLVASALFNIGISKRNFLLFSTPIVVALCVNGILTQTDLYTQIIFFCISLLFFFIIKSLQQKTELFYSEIYNRQQDMIQILEGFPGAISLVENERYLYMNSKLISLLGESVPVRTNDVIGSHDINQSLVDRIKLFKTSSNTHQEFEMDLTTTQGTKTFWILLKKLQEQKIMILSIDIDEKRNNEKRIAEQNIKLIESSKMASLGEMSSGIAHEINNPLTIIQGSTRQINRIASQLSEETKLELEKLTVKIDLMSLRITKIIKGLRSFAREGSQDPLDFVSTKQIIDETLFICESRFKNSNIDIRKNYELDTFILCRSVQISQVILNLLNNSFDAIIEKRDEHKTTGADFIEISTHKLDQQFCIRIIDSGKGIPESAREKILNPFFTTKGVGKGTGLGLSISKSIIEDHNGRLEFNFSAPYTEVNLIFNKFKN